MPDIPRDPCFDSTLALLRDPYRFISNRCRVLKSDFFHTRLGLFRTGICMSGPIAAELFYDNTRFSRAGVTPRRFEKTLLGSGGIQGLDDEPHRHRKRMFMSLMTPDRIRYIGELSDQTWLDYARKWTSSKHVVVYDEACEVITRIACAWSGVPLHESEVATRVGELVAMYDYAASIGPKHYWARIARKRAERWTSDLILRCRAGQLKPAENTALHVIATHRELNGELLSPHVAAVELLNVLRPVVAVSVYVAFAALALQNYPACRQSLRTNSNGYTELFAQEVRRFYPFFPAVGAKVRHDFDWNGYHFVKDTSVLLDLYGTNHDPRAWKEPDQFIPDRFHNWTENLYAFIPQGGGDYHQHHRCPGDPISIELIKSATSFFAQRISYEVPQQNLDINFTRVPALPYSRFIISNVKVS